MLIKDIAEHIQKLCKTKFMILDTTAGWQQNGKPVTYDKVRCHIIGCDMPFDVYDVDTRMELPACFYMILNESRLEIYHKCQRTKTAGLYRTSADLSWPDVFEQLANAIDYEYDPMDTRSLPFNPL